MTTQTTGASGRRTARRSRVDPVIFDLDGTLVDSAPVIAAALRQAFAEAGFPIDESLDLGYACGPPIEATIAGLHPDPAIRPALLDGYRRAYRVLARERSEPMPGARECLLALDGAGITLAIATYKPSSLATLVLDAAGLLGHFSIVLGRYDADDDRRKPHILAAALRALTPYRGRPLFVGDHDEDQEAARIAGVEFVRYDGAPGAFAALTRRVLG